MPAVKPVKIPCLQCKKKHVKCDEQRPTCGRCQKNNLTCSRPSKPTVFRHNTGSARFSSDQQWVNSEATEFQFDKRTDDSETLNPSLPSGTPKDDRSSAPESSPVSTVTSRSLSKSLSQSQSQSQQDHSPEHRKRKRRRTDELPRPDIDKLLTDETHTEPPGSFWDVRTPPIAVSLPSSPRPSQPVSILTLPPIWHNDIPAAWPTPSRQHEVPQLQTPRDPEVRRFPLEDVQEACLMRYYVEEIGHWLDLCDEDRHFQFVVPVRARSQPHLLFAIFAVAARHLCRIPQYQTPRGIMYQGQLLPALDKHSAVEYMLKCIPALRRFHDTEDDEYRDSIIATAVILRQMEEIDDEEDGGSEPSSGLQAGGVQAPRKQINFLPIIDAVLRSPPSQTLFGRRSLIRAAYWMALRQEIYHSFTRSQPPQMILAADYWPLASSANKAVMHTVQVMKWRWGGGSEQEWNRLMRQQEHLEQDVLADFQPIFHQRANKSKGEIFPTVWYTSNMEVTSIQQSIMARSVLLAENPTLRSPATPRATWRKVESEVRGLMLELCGIALCHPSSPPAILNAAFVIQLYGDFFTDQWERDALKRVVDKYRNINAWPSQKLTEMFG